jgi:hypothetical protein
MRIQKLADGSARLWLSASDTEQWAHKPGAVWPCSTLAGKRLFAEFAPNCDLVDMRLNGGRGSQDCDGHEFDAITSDYLESAASGSAQNCS